MNKVAIYAGTFDPITLGHLNIIERASSLFDQIIISVAKNHGKNPLFSLEERIHLASATTAHLKNIMVQGFDNLMVDFARQHHATILIRGVRTIVDLEYELQLVSMNKKMYPILETVILPAADQYRALSSTLVREIVMLQGDVTPFVPPAVLTAIQEKYR